MSMDNNETVNLNVQIEVCLHENCMIGREGYYSKFRPNHWIPGKNYTFAGQIEFTDRELLKPGETCLAVMNCIVTLQDAELFKADFAWHICEANKIVGYAKVV